jgi:hypothetical protein
MKYYIIVEAHPSSMASLFSKSIGWFCQNKYISYLIDTNLCIYNMHVVV